MSRRLIGYQGEGKHRRGVYADEGPASVSASSPFAMHGRLSALSIPETAGQIEGGAGNVERRQLSADERAARQVVDEDDESPIAPVRVAVLATVTGPLVTAQTIEEEPAMGSTLHEDRPASPVKALAEPGPFRPTSSLEDLHAIAGALDEVIATHREYLEASDRLAAAEAAFDAAFLRARVGPDDERDDPEPPDHLPAQELELAGGTVMRVHSDGAPATLAALRELGEAAVAHLAAERAAEPADDAPEVVTRPPELPIVVTAADAARKAAGGGPGRELPRQQERILDAVIALQGDRKGAATALGLSVENVNGALHSIGAKGLLPIWLITKLPAGFAKYTGV